MRSVNKEDDVVTKKGTSYQLTGDLAEDDPPDNTIAQALQHTANSITNQNSGKTANFFEGVEKLLEVWFTRAGGGTDAADLRNIPRYV